MHDSIVSCSAGNKGLAVSPVQKDCTEILKASCSLPLDILSQSVMQSDTMTPRYQLSAVAGCTGMCKPLKHRMNATPAFVISGFKEKAFF